MSRNVVLFDLDGTVMDTYQVVYDSLDFSTKKVLGKSFPEKYLLSKIGQPLIDQMDLFTEDTALQQEIVDVYHAYSEVDLDQKIAPFPKTKETLDALTAKGLKVGLVTSKREDLAERCLGYFDLVPFFACLVGAESSSKHKPNPEPLFVAAQKLDETIESCVYVGDSPYDIQAAQAAGIPVIGVTWGKFFSQEVLKELAPTYIVSTHDELMKKIFDLCGIA